MIIADINQ